MRYYLSLNPPRCSRVSLFFFVCLFVYFIVIMNVIVAMKIFSLLKELQ